MRLIYWLIRLVYPFICPLCGRHMEIVDMTCDRLYLYKCSCHSSIYPFHRTYQ